MSAEEISRRGRYVVECIWSGYRSSQSRPCHCKIEPGWMAQKLAKINGVRFNDGTHMSVRVRKCTFREKVQEIHGYNELLRKLAFADKTGFCGVDDVD